MAQAHCILDNMYCFSIATMVTRTYLNATLYRVSHSLLNPAFL